MSLGLEVGIFACLFSGWMVCKERSGRGGLSPTLGDRRLRMEFMLAMRCLFKVVSSFRSLHVSKAVARDADAPSTSWQSDLLLKPFNGSCFEDERIHLEGRCERSAFDATADSHRVA